MQYKIFNLQLDLGRDNRNAVRPVQGESAVKLRATLTQNNGPYALTGTDVRAIFRKPDHTYSYIDASIIDATKGIIEIVLTDQVLLLSGVVVALIEVAGSIGLARTWMFTIDVQPGIPNTDLESVNEFPAVNQMIIDVAEIKATFDAIIAGVTVDGEVILARAGFTTLRDRLNDSDAKKVPTTRKVAGKALTADISLAKADVGLDKVDNTSDALKPVSTPQAEALGLKVDKTTKVNGKALSADVVLGGTDIAIVDTGTYYPTDNVEAALQNAGGRIVDLEARSIKTYGVRRTLGATSPILTRIYDAVGKVANMPINDSVVANDFDNIYPWSHIKECKIVPVTNRVVYKGEPGYDLLTSDWMVEIPKFYLSITQDATNRDISIGQYRQKGFWIPQVFKTEAGVELDKIYVARFKTGKDVAVDVSRPGLFAENFRDLANFRTGAKAKGIGWQLIDLSFVQEVLYPLYSIEAATLHSQSFLGDSITSVRYVATDLAQLAEIAVNRIVVTNAMATYYNVGDGICIGTAQGSENIAFDRTITAKNQLDATNTELVFDGAPVNIAVGNVLWQGAQKTGQTVNLTKSNGKLTGVSGRTSFKYRGMEDSFGNVLEWVDGVLISERVAQICRKPSLYASTVTADYKPAGYTNFNVNGYPTELGFDNNFPEARFPITVGGGTTTGYCDYYYQDAGLRGAFFGGAAIYGSVAGLFYWYLINAPSYTYWLIGSRLLFKPPV